MKISQNGIISPMLNDINSVLSLTQSKSNNQLVNESIRNSFKVLILDSTSLNILSPLLKQSNLNKNNVCLTLNMSEKKQKISNAMAIYIVVPTQENLDKIVKEIQDKTYDNISLNFIDILKEKILQDFLSKIIKAGQIDRIYNLNFFPINFKVYHSNVFDLSIPSPYKFLNQKATEDNENVNYIDKSAIGIFSILYNLKLLPKIVYPKNDFSEDIISKTMNQFESTFKKFPDIKNEFEMNSNPNKTIMIILNRDTDLPIMLHHSGSLGGIINDLCEVKFLADNKNKPKENEFLLDPIHDFIWNRNINEPFYEIGEETILGYKKYYDEMNQFSSILKENKDNKDIEKLQKDSEKLSISIEHLSEKKLKGDILGKHAKLYGFINDILKKKNLGELFFIEDMILRKRKNNKEISTKIAEFISERKVNNENYYDFFRLNVIYFSACEDVTIDMVRKNMGKYYDKKKMENILKYIQMKKDKLKENKKPENPSGNFAKKLLKKSFMYVMSHVSALMTIEQPSIIADIVNSIMNGKNDMKDFSIFDLNDKLFEGREESRAKEYENVIVYIIGGGSLNEYEYIHSLIGSSNCNLIYGCDKLYKPNEFTNEIETMSFE